MQRKTLRGTIVTTLALMSITQSYAVLSFNATEKNQLAGVRLLDASHKIHALKPLKEISKDLEKHWNSYVDKEYKIKDVRDLFLTRVPSEQNGIYTLPIATFGKLKYSREEVFIFATVYTNKRDTQIQVSKVLPLARTTFKLQASLADRKLIVSEATGQVKMVFPIGVGAFDEGVLNDAVTLLTPRFENAYIDKAVAISKRKRPRYYGGKPFLRITTNKNPAKGRTSIGFHAQPNLDTFIRAFDSHGCMRMQTDDLQTLHDILMYGPHKRLSVNVKFKMSDPAEHPERKINRPYQKVANVGSTSRPNYSIDRDGLTQLTKDYRNFAPVDRLQDIAGDNYHAIYDYDMQWREAERMKRHTAQCAKEFPYQQVEGKWDRKKMYKKFKKCVKKGKRNTSFRDRLYRWWVD